jgi:hypothetical protein
MIRCTGVNADLKSIPFQSELERKMGFALGTADLLGQMARGLRRQAGILFLEFDEANHFSHRTAVPAFSRPSPNFAETHRPFGKSTSSPRLMATSSASIISSKAPRREYLPDQDQG